MSYIIEVQHLNKAYGDFPVFFDLNLNVKTNSATALLGPNGCGKTTLLKSLLGVTKVNSGNVYLFNSPVMVNGKSNMKLLTAARKKIGFIPDQNIFYDHLTAYEYLSLIYNLTIPEYPDKEKNGIDTVKSILKEFRLDRWSNRLIYTFSTGTKQKLAIAASLVHRPELLIMDEPFRGIDPEANIKFIKFLTEFIKSGIPLFGIQSPGSIFMSSHILTDIEKICDSMIVLNEYGEIVLTGEINEVKERLSGEKSFEELLYQILHEEDEKEEQDNELLDDLDFEDEVSESE